MKFKLNKKTGLCTYDKVLLINDKNNMPFYLMNNKKGGLFKFNLPLGTYYSENNLQVLPSPVFYSKPKLKPRYNFDRVPEKFTIRYANNPNKCSVDLKRHLIIFDNSFKNKPRFFKDYIKFHELGHYFYSGKGQQSEKDCDNFSAYCMICVGYNPLQIRVANKYTLSNNPEGMDRKIENENFLRHFKQYD